MSSLKMLPPPYSSDPGHAPYNQTVSVSTPCLATSSVNYGPRPQPFACPNCGFNDLTKVRHEWTSRTHWSALLLCILGCWPCAMMTYFMESCQVADHYCPGCELYLGTYRR